MGLLRRRRQTSQLVRNDHEFLGRTSEPDDLVVVKAEGSRIRDARGRTFIDFQCGWNAANLGWNQPEILSRVQRFDGPAYVAPGFVYGPWVDLASELAYISPGDLQRAYRCISGTEAVELALQLAMTATGRKKIVSLEDAYHGNSIGAKSVGEGELDAHVAGWKQLAPPLDESALDRLESRLKHRDVAAFIMEPVVMNLNVYIPDSVFMRGLVPLCHRYGTLVILDEVACGLGRTGKMFAAEHWDVQPDLMCLAKSLSGGIAPIATTLATAEIADECEGELSFYSTFGWMPLGVEAALATLEFWRTHRDELLANIEARSTQIAEALIEIFPDAARRIKGLAIALDLGKRKAERIEERCRERGLLVYAEDESLVMFPALTIDDRTVDQGLAILEKAAR
ncbi:MAG: aspartate aminotransferase family protein [Kofleriaceae bacterium]|nr:aspartate aminotransferase family protein [Kofleriaceae bacterium]